MFRIYPNFEFFGGTATVKKEQGKTRHRFARTGKGAFGPIGQISQGDFDKLE
jgi:hypothetical protein